MGTINGVGETGLLDISKDGRYGIDGYLQVYDLRSGSRVMSICGEHVTDGADDDGGGNEDGLELCSLVRLTHDGKYAIWVDVSVILHSACLLMECSSLTFYQRLRVGTNVFQNEEHVTSLTELFQELTLKVCRLEDGRIIANTSTHEEVTSLVLLEFGYLIVIGREDGHVVTMKLMDPAVIGYETSAHDNLTERQNWVSREYNKGHKEQLMLK